MVRSRPQPLEVKVLRKLRASGLLAHLKQYEVYDLNGDYVMRLDFAWPHLKVALHVDSYLWHSQRERFDRDARPPLTIVRDIVPPYDAYSIDVAQAHGSLAAFHAAGFPYEHVLAGHGQPLVDDARTKVLRALEKWPRPRAR